MESNNTSKIIAALAKATAEFQPVLADKHIKYGATEFSYANLDSIIQATRPILAKYGLVLISHPITNGKEITLKTTLMHESGEELKAPDFVMFASGIQPKEIGGAITYARRYSQLSFLNVYGEEPDLEEIEKGVQKTTIPPKVSNNPPVSAPQEQPKEASKAAPRNTQEVTQKVVDSIRELVFKLTLEQRDALWSDLGLSKEDVTKIGTMDLNALFDLKGTISSWIEVNNK